MTAIACAVPARWASSRFPGKMLHPLEGTPVIVHTLRRAREADCFSEVVCLTDSAEIARVVMASGFDAVITGEAANGTDRIGRHLEKISADLIVNLQGDEPAFPAEGLRLLRAALGARPLWAHVLVHDGEPSPEEMANPNRVKAGLDAQDRVLDFYRREPMRPVKASRVQMGAYGYSKNFLRRYAALPPSPREIAESHEMLRSLDLAPIAASRCAHSSQAVDVSQDLEPAAALVRRTLQGGAQGLTRAAKE
jgi:CMP-2-keto-3-deoxyoctulosonic acid synthetase